MPLASRFLILSPEQRAQAFEQAAAGRAAQAAFLEHDFWLSWLLGQLFAQPQLAPHLVLKGGTSLSKIYGLTDRISQNIDMCLLPEFVGADTRKFEALGSRVKRTEAMREMQRLCREKVQQVVLPLLEAAITSALGPSPADAWLQFSLGADEKSPSLSFHYPSAHPKDCVGGAPEVKVELSTLPDQTPTGCYPLRPLIADAFPILFGSWHCEVTALELERTFWEKATILHGEYHRPADSPTPERCARHYFDMARLLAHPHAPLYMADKAQCEHVANWKSSAFACRWARYDLARHGSFRLVPPEWRQPALAQDYARIRTMFKTEPPPFAKMMRQLAIAEAALNAT
jgi:hypothetical protein